mgnify:CR=1 FL=1
MAYNILGINPFHNGSACVLSDGKLVYYLEEERISKLKYDPNPFRVILDILNRFDIHEIAIGGINIERKSLYYNQEEIFEGFLKKYIPHIKVTNYSHSHHLLHFTQAYSNSGFDNALGIVHDAGGSVYSSKDNENIQETYSIFKCSNNSLPINLDKKFTPKISNVYSIGIASSYSAMCYHLGFRHNEEGKVMGLSSYGKNIHNFPSLFENFFSKKELISEDVKEDGFRYSHINNKIFSSSNSFEWHKDSSKITDYEYNLAFHIQNESQNEMLEFIKEQVYKYNIKNVICSGGFFLNCVANYYYKKQLPDINFYFSPISHDGGTSVGAAFLKWKELNSNFNSLKEKTIYYGPQYSKDQLLEGIQKYVSN